MYYTTYKTLAHVGHLYLPGENLEISIDGAALSSRTEHKPVGFPSLKTDAHRPPNSHEENPTDNGRLMDSQASGRYDSDTVIIEQKGLKEVKTDQEIH